MERIVITAPQFEQAGRQPLFAREFAQDKRFVKDEFIFLYANNKKQKAAEIITTVRRLC